MDDIRIIGAGLAGLLAAVRWPNAQVYEARARDEGPNHKALLRFRTDSVSQLTGIPFRRVRVDKSIWVSDRHHSDCNIALANAYSKKVLNKFAGGRSIWNLTPDTRHVAPHDFEQQLLDRIDGAQNRIAWSNPVWTGDFTKGSPAITISTMPMDKLLEKIAHTYPVENVFKFDHSTIFVRRYKLPETTDLFQTIYFCDPSTPVYRASITGDMLIIEESQLQPDCTWSGMGHEPLEEKGYYFDDVLRAFGLSDLANWEVQFIDSKLQHYGKIIDLPRIDRESIMYELTREYNIYSLGRFATWRNVLLDDLVHDMEFINRLITSSAYQRHAIVNRPAAMPQHPDWLNSPSDESIF